MKKQSDKTNLPPLETDHTDDEEITVKKVSPFLVEDDSLEQQEANQESLDYKLLYEEASHALKEEKENALFRLAETENFRKRLIKEKEDLVKFANVSLLQELLPCLDNLDMTLTHATAEQMAKDPVINGVNLMRKQFLQTLQKNGLEEIGGEGLAFDPNFQEAIATKASESVPSGHVIEVNRKGYRLQGRLLRAALVTVSQ